MSIHVPSPIAAYIKAENAHDAQAVAACFTDEAVVRDEGKTIEGRAAIRAWKVDTSKKYSATISPSAVEAHPHGFLVAAIVSGDFPGSPLEMKFDFTLAGERIAALEIGV
jgi:ketosteroid isomerase-like protein